MAGIAVSPGSRWGLLAIRAREVYPIFYDHMVLGVQKTSRRWCKSMAVSPRRARRGPGSPSRGVVAPLVIRGTAMLANVRPTILARSGAASFVPVPREADLILSLAFALSFPTFAFCFAPRAGGFLTRLARTGLACPRPDPARPPSNL